MKLAATIGISGYLDRRQRTPAIGTGLLPSLEMTQSIDMAVVGRHGPQ